MQTQTLDDLTIIIPFRIDSSERLRNIKLVTHWLQTNFKVSIILVEQDGSSRFSLPSQRNLFSYSTDPIFWRTKAINQALSEVTTPVVAIMDTDVVVNPDSITRSVSMILDKTADIVYPYNGMFFDVPRNIFECVDRDLFQVVNGGDRKSYGIMNRQSWGGLFLANTERYRWAGGENENFRGWGYEDTERRYRFSTVGLNVFRLTGLLENLFHLSHSRGPNSGYNHPYIHDNFHEAENIMKMNQAALLGYIQTWNWKR